MRDNKEELEQLVQENIKPTETYQNVVGIRRVCCVKINPNWKFKLQWISVIAILLLACVAMIIIFTISIMQSIQNTLCPPKLNFIGIYKSMNFHNNLIQRQIQMEVDSSARFLTISKKLLQEFFITNQTFSVPSTSYYLVDATKNAINNNSDLAKNPSLFTEYVGLDTANKEFQFAQQISQLFSIGLIQSDTMSTKNQGLQTQICFNGKNQLIISISVNLEDTLDSTSDGAFIQSCSGKKSNQKQINQHEEPFNILLQNKTIKFKNGTLFAIIQKQISYSVYEQVIPLTQNYFFLNSQGQVVSNQYNQSFYDVKITGYDINDWNLINKFFQNKSQSHSGCGGSSFSYLNGKALCLLNKFTNLYSIVFPNKLFILIKGRKVTLISLLFLDMNQITIPKNQVQAWIHALNDQIFHTLIGTVVVAIFFILIAYCFILYILKPFKQIIQFTDQQVSKNKQIKMKEKNLQLSEIQGSGLAGQLVDAYKRLLQGNEGISKGNSNEIIQNIQRLPYPSNIVSNSDRTSKWKTQSEQIKDLNFDIMKAEKFTKSHIKSERDYAITLKKFKKSKKETYDSYIKLNQFKLKRDLINNVQSEQLQEAIAKMIVLENQDQKKLLLINQIQ